MTRQVSRAAPHKGETKNLAGEESKVPLPPKGCRQVKDLEQYRVPLEHSERATSRVCPPVTETCMGNNE